MHTQVIAGAESQRERERRGKQDKKDDKDREREREEEERDEAKRSGGYAGPNVNKDTTSGWGLTYGTEVCARVLGGVSGCMCT